MAVVEVPQLQAAVADANKQASQKVQLIKGQQAVALIGCTGAGKTTMAVYAQGGKFKRDKKKIVLTDAGTSSAAFQLGDKRSSETRGMSTAPLPNGLTLVDLAGTEDTEGLEQDLCAAIYRASGFKEAGSMRVVLVVHLDRFSINNAKGQYALRDFETVAGLFGVLSERDLNSIGMVFSGQPSDLEEEDATKDLLTYAADALKGFKDAIDEGKIVISDGGKKLLDHFSSECQKAIDIKVPECEEPMRLDKMIESQCRVWPLNVLRTDSQDQSHHLLRWLVSLKPAERSDWACELPPQSQEKLKGLLDGVKDEVAKKVLRDYGINWAARTTLVDEVLSLLSFVNVLDTLNLLPAAKQIQTNLCDQLGSQNTAAYQKVELAVRMGMVSSLEDTICALEAMDNFRNHARLPKGIRIPGWKETALVKQEVVIKAAEELKKMFGDGLAATKWDAPKAAQVGNIFEAVKALGDVSRGLLTEWAKNFLENAEALKMIMGECGSCTSVVHAHERLREYEEFLENLLKLLAPFGCQTLADGGVAQVIKTAKDGVEKQLDHLSKEVVQQRSTAPSAPSPNWERLQQLCGSTEIQTILGREDLLQTYVLQPLARRLSPAQSELDDLAKLIEQAEPAEWASLVKSFAARIEGMGELAPTLLESNGLSYAAFVDQVMSRVKGSKNKSLEAVNLLKTPVAPRPRGRYAASVRSGGTALEFDDEGTPQHQTDGVEEALQVLVHLLPLDPLLPLMNGPIGNPVTTALDSVGWVVKGALKTVLRQGKTAQQNSWSTWTLEDQLLPILKNLKELLGLAKDAALQREGLREGLQELGAEAEGFIKSFVETPLEEWANATTEDFPAWLESFKAHLDMADLIRHLANLDEVTRARSELLKKISSWRNDCLSRFRGAKEWQDVIKCGVMGMSFEGSPLFGRLPDIKPEFTSLVETLATTWKAEAAAVKAGGTRRPYQKLKALSDALLTLSDESTVSLRAREVRNSIRPSLERLETLMSENETRLTRLINERKFFEAWKEVEKMEDKELYGDRWRDELIQAIQDDAEQLQEKGLHDAAAAAGRKARRLLDDLRRLPEEQKILLQEHVQKIQEAVGKKKQEASEQLTRALEGRGAAKKALEVLSALGNTSDEDTAHEFLLEHIVKQKEELAGMGLNELKEWIIRHDQVRLRLPDEFRTNLAALDDLMAAFLKCFEVSVKKREPEIHELQSSREWGTLGRIHAGLRDIIESVKKVGVMAPHEKTIRICMAVLGIGSDVKIAIEKVKEGQGAFGPALMAIVTGSEESLEELYSAINQELSKNLLDTGRVPLGHRLQVLESFIEEVKDSPPDRLRGLWNQVKIYVQQMTPELQRRAEQATQQMQNATKGEDLTSLASALVQLENFPGRVDKEELDRNVRSFWDSRVKGALVKVKKDVAEMNVQGLSVSIEPFRRWLRQLELLPSDQQRLVLNTLQPGVADLKAWIREALSDTVRSLVDPVKQQSLLAVQHFAEVSQMHQVGCMLHTAFDVTLPSLQKAEDMAMHANQEAHKALNRGLAGLRDFNGHFKVLKAMSTELKEVSTLQYITDLTNKIETDIINSRQMKLHDARQPQEATQLIGELRGVASEAPELYEKIDKILGQELQHLKGKMSYAAMNEVGSLLGAHQEGQFVIQEHTQIFGAIRDMQNNATFRRAGETSKLEDVVGKLTRDSKLGGDEYWALLKAMEAHEKLFDELRRTYLVKGTQFADVLARVHHGVQQAAQQCSSSNPESARVLLTHLAIAFTVVKCGQEVLAAATFDEEMDRLVRPHRSQILSLFRLLHIHGATPAPLWQRLVSAVASAFTSSSGGAPENHLVQVLTGEGKCLTLGLLASFLALKGIPSDIVCYRKFLVEQDSAAMKPLYEFLGIQDKVRYATFDELCGERLEGLKTSAKELMDSQTTPTGSTRRDVSNRALLIDEVDVFFGRSFYGETWDGGFKADGPEAKALIRYVFEETMQGRPILRILQSQQLRDVLARYSPLMRPALEAAALSLVENVKDFAKPKPHLDKETGRIGYKEKNEINYDLVYPNKTCFAYLKFEFDKELTKEQVDPHLGIDLLCGRFSFAEMPMGYRCILGVTGTLQELCHVNKIQHILTSEYFFKHSTITPSIFGARNLTFSWGEHVDILDTESDWIARIEAIIKQSKDAKNAILAFFKNEEMLEKIPGFQDYATVTERTPAIRRRGYINSATGAGRATLFTRAFGRGVDFQMPDGHQVEVLQTFLSSLSSEQTQIKGRTARQGKHGTYRMVLCAEHLQAKFGFTDAEIAALKNASGEQKRVALEGKQMEKMRSKAEGMSERKKKAFKLEQETRNWERKLFDPAVSVDEKLKELCAWNNCYQQVHYTLLLDISSSMWGEPWRQLTVAFQSFLGKLTEDVMAAASSLVSVVTFNSAASAITMHRPPGEVTGLSHVTVGGGTHFPSAFRECHQILGRSDPRTKEHILFLTDGCGGDPTREINALLNDHASRITNFTAIAFGAAADQRALNQYGALFQARRITFKCMTPGDEASLIQTFVGAVNSGPFHQRG